METNSEFIDTKEVCKMFGVSRVTVGEWRKAGMPYVKFGNRSIRFNKEEVVKWVNEKFAIKK